MNTGVNLMLQFFPPSGPTDNVSKEYVDCDKDPTKVRNIQHLLSVEYK